MQEGRASRTASRVALRRAAHQLLDVPLVFDDPLALKVIRWDAAELLRNNPAHFERGRLTKYLRAFLAVRSRIAEDVVAEEISKGARQVVILGAGLDTFSLRNQQPDVRVFEVDHPATQAWKQRRLADTAIPIPPTVTFVPVDFERHNLRESLMKAGLDPQRPAVFSWLGVTPYLEEAAIWQTLADIAFFSTTGGGVIFDYSIPPSNLSFFQRWVFRRLAKRVAKAGEPFRSYFDPPALVQRLGETGFSRVSDLGQAEMNARYFAGRADGLKVGSVGRVMIALK
jgi:methyltransferase (TIGR00027 family)